MESARIETLLHQGWNLIGQLHQWISNQPDEHQDPDHVVGLIASLQSVWGKADDLEMKRLARRVLALELFFERLFAKKLGVEHEYLKDVSASITGLEDLLLGLEATGAEPDISDLESLVRLERWTSRKYSSNPARKSIEIAVPGNDPSRSIIHAELIGVHSTGGTKTPIVMRDSDFKEAIQETGELETTPVPKRIDHKLVPRLEQRGVTRFEVQETVRSQVIIESARISDHGHPATTVRSHKILILVESLFYRHLIEMALQSAGYETEAIDPADSESDWATQIPILIYRAILVTPTGASKRIEQIQKSQEMGQTRVIGLNATEQHENFVVELDACVWKSKPQQLISVLEQLFNPSSDFPRKIA